MFITTAGFKSLIKEAYKNGRLVAGATQEEYLFEGSCWVIRVDRDAITEGENLPEGPRALTDGRGAIYWKNNSMTMAVLPVFHEDNDELGIHLRLLGNMELPEQRFF